MQVRMSKYPLGIDGEETFCFFSAGASQKGK